MGVTMIRSGSSSKVKTTAMCLPVDVQPKTIGRPDESLESTGPS
jgi:hypothetical protein